MMLLILFADTDIMKQQPDRKRCCRVKGSLSAAAVHKQYDEGISAFKRQIADPTLRMKFSQEVDIFM